MIFRTGWEERSGSARFFQEEWPGFSPAAADALLAEEGEGRRAGLPVRRRPESHRGGFAISTSGCSPPAFPIFEALVNLARRRRSRRFFFIGLPLGIDRGEASPVRAIALLGSAADISGTRRNRMAEEIFGNHPFPPDRKKPIHIRGDLIRHFIYPAERPHFSAT